MCIVSNIGDYGRDMWPLPKRGDWVPMPDSPVFPVKPAIAPPYNGPTKEQFEEFLELLRAARKLDISTGQKDCPSEDKTAWIREMAKLVGVDPAKVDEILKSM